MPAPYPSPKDPWRCEWCGAHKVVPSLAQDCCAEFKRSDCEHNHMTEDECQPSTAADTQAAHD